MHPPNADAIAAALGLALREVCHDLATQLADSQREGVAVMLDGEANALPGEIRPRRYTCIVATNGLAARLDAHLEPFLAAERNPDPPSPNNN